MGLRNGDKIVSVDGKVIDNFDKIPLTIILNKAHSIEVMRGGQQVSVPVSEDNISAMLGDPKGFIQPQFPPVVDSVIAKSGAAAIGLKKGDVITKIDTVPINYYQEISPVLQKFTDKDVKVTFTSGTQTNTQTAHIDKDGKLGFVPKPPTDFLQTDKQTYSLFASIPEGITRAKETITGYAQQLKVIFTVKGASKQVGGFITIGKAYGKVWDWQHFWAFTGFLSIMLAFLNILPIPALDGGHVLFLLYEMITGRKPSEKFMEYAQYAGMIILLSILVFANGNDVLKLFHK
jgi:regulator of sigma E protease